MAQLQPALAGFPVVQLLDAFVCAAPDDRASAHQLMDRCLVSWIASLDTALDAYPDEPDDSLERIQQRQRGARNALAELKVALAKTEVARPNRGQLC